jgi:hypothetical protein
MIFPFKNKTSHQTFCIFWLILFFCSQAYAWNKPGHMTTGAIAAKELKSSDSTALARVVALLKKHPSYQNVWKPIVSQRAGLDNEAIVLFAYAARWPDDARGTSDHRELWHYINYPFKPAGQPASVNTADPQDVNIEEAFSQNIEILRNASSSDVAKAKALCWLFHLTGDAHQPLHSSALFTSAYPAGDKGGTLFFVKVPGIRSAVKLHALWDSMVIDSDDFSRIHDGYISLSNEYERDELPNVNESDHKEWVQESFRLAKEKAYLDGKLKAGATKRTAEKLPHGYINDSKPIARQRMALAGYRLADFLGQLF